MDIRNAIYVGIALTIFAVSTAQAEGNVGRYQLFQGEYPFINLKGEEHWSKALIKLDTATGKMYVCQQDQVLGKYLEREGEAYQRRYCREFEQDLPIQDLRDRVQ